MTSQRRLALRWREQGGLANCETFMQQRQFRCLPLGSSQSVRFEVCRELFSKRKPSREAVMRGRFHAIKFGLAILTVVLMMAGASPPSHAQTGSVRIVISRVGLIVGPSVSSGTLHFQGKRYALRIGGISIGAFGAGRAALNGRAFHLRTAASIHGVYSAVSAIGAVADGSRTVRLQNSLGIVLVLRGRQSDPEVFVDPRGMDVSLR